MEINLFGHKPLRILMLMSVNSKGISAKNFASNDTTNIAKNCSYGTS
jgi:hypothetical protein